MSKVNRVWSIYDLTERSTEPKPQQKKQWTKEEKRENFKKYYSIRIVKVDGSWMISYTPISSRIGSYFVLALREAAQKLELYPVNIMGLGPNDASYRDVAQTWQLKPEPSWEMLDKLRKEIDRLLKLKNLNH